MSAQYLPRRLDPLRAIQKSSKDQLVRAKGPSVAAVHGESSLKKS